MAEMEQVKTPASTGMSKKLQFALMYWNFVLGLLMSVPHLPTKAILMDDLGVTPATMAAVLSWVSVPWAIKPVFGFISDRVPVPALFSAGLVLNSISWYALSTGSRHGFGLTGIGILLFLASLTLVIAQVSGDCLVVENTKKEVGDEVGQLQSNCWVAQSVGACVAAILTGLALDNWGLSPESALDICAVLAGSGLISVFLSLEPKQQGKGAEDVNPATPAEPVPLLGSIDNILAFWRRPEIWKTALFAAIFASAPTPKDAIFYFFRNQLHMGMGFLGSLEVMGFAATAVGAWWFQQSLRKVAYPRLLTTTIASSFAMGLTMLAVILGWNRLVGIPDQVFAYGDGVALAAYTQVAWMPIILHASRVAPPGAEGAVYQTIISLWNLCAVFSEFMGAGLTGWLGIRGDDYSRLGVLVIVCGLFKLIPIPFLASGFVPALGTLDEPEEGASASGDAAKASEGEGAQPLAAVTGKGEVVAKVDGVAGAGKVEGTPTLLQADVNLAEFAEAIVLGAEEDVARRAADGSTGEDAGDGKGVHRAAAAHYRPGPLSSCRQRKSMHGHHRARLLKDGSWVQGVPLRGDGGSCITAHPRRTTALSLASPERPAAARLVAVGASSQQTSGAMSRHASMRMASVSMYAGASRMPCQAFSRAVPLAALA
eukprot:jgi/Mesvir1/16239/Mv08492-RA.1